MPVMYIKDLVVSGRHGVYPHEKEHAQRFSISVELTVSAIDLAKAAASDDLADTINYSAVRDTIIDVIEHNSYNLIERLAQQIADRILLLPDLSLDPVGNPLPNPRAQNLVLSIDKLDAFKTGTPGIRLEINQSASPELRS